MNFEKYPKQEDVNEFQFGNNKIQVVNVTEENIDHLVKATIMMYINEPCRICGKMITEKDIPTMVWAGYSSNNDARSAHGICWEKYPSEDGETPHPIWVYQ